MKNLFVLVLLSVPLIPTQQTLPTPQIFKINIVDTNYTKSQKEKLERSKALLWKVFNSKELVEAFRARKAFSDNQGLSNMEILSRLLKASEALVPGDDSEMDLTVTMYRKSFTKVVGYTTPKSNIVYTNSKFHDSFTACQVGANLSHEWAHKIGFDHKSASDKDSVPYALGDMVLEICEKF